MGTWIPEAVVGMENAKGPSETAVEAPDAGWETPGEVARIAEASVELVRRYADEGLIPSARDGYGRRKFPPGTGVRVRELKAARTGRRQAAE